MNLFLKTRKGVDAKGVYNPEKHEFIVLKGSKVSGYISESPRFGGKNTVKKYRDTYTKNGVVVKNIIFKSSSTAANFVTGSSTNGMLAWKNENNEPLKSLIK